MVRGEHKETPPEEKNVYINYSKFTWEEDIYNLFNYFLIYSSVVIYIYTDTHILYFGL